MARKWKPRPEIWRKRAVSSLAVVVLAGLGWVLIVMVQERLAEAEATSVRVTLNNLRSQLVIEQSTAAVKQQQGRLAALEGRNPFELAETQPGSYSGECHAEAAEQSRGSWCYDPEEKAIYYRPRFDAALPGRRGPDGRHGWRLELNRERPGQPELQLSPLAEDEK